MILVPGGIKQPWQDVSGGAASPSDNQEHGWYTNTGDPVTGGDSTRQLPWDFSGSASGNTASSSSATSAGNTWSDNAEFDAWLKSFGLQAAEQRELMNMSMSFNADQAALSRQFSALENEKLRAWQEQMQGSYFQRTVEDMKKAGLNPAMMYGSYSGGSSAISSSGITGASASVNTPGSSNGQGFSFESTLGSATQGLGVIAKILGTLALLSKFA